jgi:hypothetical protein
MTIDVEAAIAGILLAIYVAIMLYGLASPRTQADPQRGQAVGCIMIMVAGLLLLGVLLAAGWYFRSRLLVRIVSAFCVFPVIHSFLSVLQSIYRKLTSPK